MWMDLAISGVKAIGGYLAAKEQAESDRKWQKYRNKMQMLQGANQQNAITTNENIAREASAEQAFLIRVSEYKTKASAEVSAAAAGTEGRSVNHILFDIGRNAAIADRDRLRDLELQYLGFDEQRKQIALQTKLSLDMTDIPNPNPFTYAAQFLGEQSGNLKELFSGWKPTSVQRQTGPAPVRSTDPWVGMRTGGDPWNSGGINMRL